MKKALKIFAIALGGLVAFVLAAILIFWLVNPLFYSDFYSNAQKELPIDGLADGFVPQGFCYVEEMELFLYCGYMADGIGASRIYVCDKDGNSRFLELMNEEGKAYTGHTGGITAGDRYVWLANDGDGEDNCVWVLSLDEILSEDSDSTVLSDAFYPAVRSAYCHFDGEYLWIGEFGYAAGGYETDPSHKISLESGDVNPALVCAYLIDEDMPFGISDVTPKKILSVREKVQGMTVDAEGRIVLSCSFGLSNSGLYMYGSIGDEHDTVYTVNGIDVPVWILDSERLIDSVSYPPFGEEIVALDGRIHIMTESACTKYIVGIFMRGFNVYSYKF